MEWEGEFKRFSSLFVAIQCYYVYADSIDNGGTNVSTR